MALPRFEIDRTALLIVDVQEKLLPFIHDQEGVEAQCIRLIRGCAALDVPVLVTEQYPKGLGGTTSRVREALPPGTPVETKLKFSACIEGIRRRLQELGRTHVLICGIEAHVCVSQTVLDLIAAGYIAGIVEDAIGSRRASDREIALKRMQQASAVPLSVEMALFELVHEAGTERFQAILPIIK